MPTHVLLAEDDEDLRNILSQYLEVFEFRITPASDGLEALALFEKDTFDICVLDVMMPKMDGFTLAEKMIESDPDVPFIFLTARNQKEDKLRGLKLGADDYIVKPFEADELVLRMNNILKRKGRSGEIFNEPTTYTIGEYSVDMLRLELSHSGNVQQLTKREGELIHYLYANRNTLLKREQILQSVWGSKDFFSGRSMDVFISRLRKYFKDDPAVSIKSTRGIGLELRVS